MIRWVCLPVSALVTAAVAMGTLGCSANSAPRPATGEEAGRLALARYTTYLASPMRVRISAPMADGLATVDGVVDYRNHRGLGGYRTPDGGTGYVAWDLRGLGLAIGGTPSPDTGQMLDAAGKLGPRAWSGRNFTDDPFDTVLHLSLALAQDRPDNPQLLAQQNPQWLRSAGECEVFSGPRPLSAPEGRLSPLSYCVDVDGRLHWATMRIAGSDVVATVELAGTFTVEVPVGPWGIPPGK